MQAAGCALAGSSHPKRRTRVHAGERPLRLRQRLPDTHAAARSRMSLLEVIGMVRLAPLPSRWRALRMRLTRRTRRTLWRACVLVRAVNIHTQTHAHSVKAPCCCGLGSHSGPNPLAGRSSSSKVLLHSRLTHARQTFSAGLLLRCSRAYPQAGPGCAQWPPARHCSDAYPARECP